MSFIIFIIRDKTIMILIKSGSLKNALLKASRLTVTRLYGV